VNSNELKWTQIFFCECTVYEFTCIYLNLCAITTYSILFQFYLFMRNLYGFISNLFEYGIRHDVRVFYG
jgi:hypothetical protein